MTGWTPERAGVSLNLHLTLDVSIVFLYVFDKKG